MITFGDKSAGWIQGDHWPVTSPGCGQRRNRPAARRPLVPVVLWLAWPGFTIQGMAFDELLADRVRTCLQQAAGVSEKEMPGGLAFLTGAHLDRRRVRRRAHRADWRAGHGRGNCPAGRCAASS